MAILPTDAIKDPSPQLQAVLRWVDAAITTLDLKELEAAITEDFTYQVLPLSLGRPKLEKVAFLEYADTFLMRVVKDFKVRSLRVDGLRSKV